MDGHVADEGPSPLSGYRVLDLTTSSGWLCGKILADLGCEVLKIEPPEGDPDRRRGPHLGDPQDPETALRWRFQNRGKRSITLDLDHQSGQARLRELARDADALLESADPGWAAARDIDYPTLRSINPRLVYTAITPFGQTGPYARFQGGDLVLGAMSGAMYLTGDPDRPPVRISVPQYEQHGAAEAALNTLIALYHAGDTGYGQLVDVAALPASIRSLMNATQFPPLEGRDLKRGGAWLDMGKTRWRSLYPCRDGHVVCMLVGASLNDPGLSNLVAWMREEIELPPAIAREDWSRLNIAAFLFDPEKGKLLEHLSEALDRFFVRHTKAELYEEGIRRRILLAPVNTVADIHADPQLRARGYFQPLEDDARQSTEYPTLWAHFSRTPLARTRRAPRIGEHNGEDDWLSPRRHPPRSATAQRPRERAFEGLKVWDMSWVGVGPLTARYLADNGATVVRLDSAARPDILRSAPPFKDGKPGYDNTMFYGDYNCSKLGLGLNLGKPEAVEIARRMAHWADIVIESFTPGHMAKWGLDYGRLSEEHPDLIMLSTCMQGQTGPRAAYPGFGNLMAAISGYYAVTGWPDRDPSPVYGAYTDFVAHRFATLALLAALDHRRRTGEGQYIDVSQYEASLQFLGAELLGYAADGRIATRCGNADPDASPHGVYPCRGEDSWVAIAVVDDSQWRSLKEAMGRPAWAEDPAFDELPGRLAGRERIDEEIARWTSSREPGDIFLALQPDVPAGPVYDQSSLHRDPQLKAWGYFVELDHPVMGRVPYNGAQSRFSAMDNRPHRPSPCIGEHSRHVLRHILGLQEAEIERLIAAKAVEAR